MTLGGMWRQRMHMFTTVNEWPIAMDAEGGGLGGSSDSNGANSDGAAGGFADAGNASASFDGSVSATAGGVGNSGLDSFGSFGGATGGSTVDLGQSGASPSSSSAMQFSTTDAATLGGLAAIGIATIATSSVGWGLAVTAGTALMDAGPVADAASHAVHDLGVIGATSPVNDPNSIGLFGTATESAAIDAVNHDGGFGNVYDLGGTGSIWDVSNGGNVAITDHIGGHSAYWDNALGLPTS